MTERPNFDRAYLNRELRRLESKLQRGVTIYVAGGGAMALVDLKVGTKDIDVVLDSITQVDSLTSALRRLGYVDPRKIVPTRRFKMPERAVLENKDQFRWDIYERAIANKLVLSKGMIGRTRDYPTGSKTLRVKLLAREDIFLLKSVTERAGDLEDMRRLAEAGLDWSRISEECQWQTSHTRTIWENAVCERLKELRIQYKIRSPIEKRICKIAEQKVLALERGEAPSKAKKSSRPSPAQTRD